MLRRGPHLPFPFSFPGGRGPGRDLAALAGLAALAAVVIVVGGQGHETEAVGSAHGGEDAERAGLWNTRRGIGGDRGRYGGGR